jgi:hypothetical protein
VVRVYLFVWLLPLDPTGKGGPTSSYATAGIALRVSGALKPHHHDKVEIPLVGWTPFLEEKRNQTSAPLTTSLLQPGPLLTVTMTCVLPNAAASDTMVLLLHAEIRGIGYGTEPVVMWDSVSRVGKS